MYVCISIYSEMNFGQKISKRDFLRQSFYGICSLAYGFSAIKLLGEKMENTVRNLSGGTNDLWKWSKEAFHYEKLDGSVKCLLCPNACNLKNGQTSVCHNRVNKNGKLFSITYGNPCTVHVDPIEKKPLYHYFPGSRIYSIATAGAICIVLIARTGLYHR